MRLRAPSTFLALTISILAACTAGGPKAEPGGHSSNAAITDGGGIVFGAEEWPECLNPITTCAWNPWTFWTVLQHVLPRAMQVGAHGGYAPSPLLAETPTIENGGLTPGPPFRVTYHLNPRALWADGTPITGDDFVFTWKAILGTVGSIWKESNSGPLDIPVPPYGLIENVEAPTPDVAVITLPRPRVDWPEFFGGSFGFVLERHAFRKHANGDRVDLRNKMLDRIPFSGGPWLLDSWSRDEAVLKRNDTYYGTVPNFDAVTFVPRLDPPDEIRSIDSGEVAAIFPGSTRDVIPPNPMPSSPNVKTLVTSSPRSMWIWFNAARPPTNDPRVRQALMFTIDPAAIVARLHASGLPAVSETACGLVGTDGFGPWCRDHPFQRYRYDPERARQLLEQAGYDCSSSQCTRDGKPLRLEYETCATNSLRTTTQEVMVDEAATVGLQPRTLDIARGLGGILGCLFPFRTFNVGDYAVSASPSGGLSQRFRCDQIPSEANGYQGSNWNGWCDRFARSLMREVDSELDADARLQLLRRLYEREAEDAVALPLYVVPAVSAWRTDKIAGPIGKWSATPYGLFFNMDEWRIAV